jgi:hypothetical protein
MADNIVTGEGYENWSSVNATPITDAATERAFWGRQIAAINQGHASTPEGAQAVFNAIRPYSTDSKGNITYQTPQWPSKYENPLVLSVQGSRIIGTQAAWVPPPPPIPGPPAAIDLLKAGDQFQKDGVLFEVFVTPFGNMARKVGPVPPPAPIAPTAASVMAALVTYVKDRYTQTSDAPAQRELDLLLAFLAGLKLAPPTTPSAGGVVVVPVPPVIPSPFGNL